MKPALTPVSADAATAPAVWAIVVTHGGQEEITAACIDSLLAQDYPALTVLLVDNASFDGSGQRLRERYRSIEYLNTQANLGYTGGNNRGIEHAERQGADYVLVLNNDTVVDPACVSTLISSALAVQGADQMPPLGAIAPKILYYDDPARVWFAGGDYSYLRAVGVHRHEMEQDDPHEAARLDSITFFTGCCVLIPTPVARGTGGFREDFFMYCEDAELSLRLRRNGYGLYYQPAARVLHRQPPGRSLTPAFAAMHRDRNRRRLVRQHYGLWSRILFASWFYPTRVLRVAQYLVAGDWRGARAVLRGAVTR
jgi:GT2 family glycosyltransferase